MFQETLAFSPSPSNPAESIGSVECSSGAVRVVLGPEGVELRAPGCPALPLSQGEARGLAALLGSAANRIRGRRA